MPKTLAITVDVPIADMAKVGQRTEPVSGPASKAPAQTIWTSIHPRLLELIQAHRSTLLFVNSRRLAERLAAALNELAGETLVRAHHGSLARAQRTEIEDLLKSGRLRGLVATSSLELGIDMGAIDLVVQIEAPPSVASGLQRIGRAGHQVGETSEGVIFPKFRGDLLASAAVAAAMIAGDVEPSRIPRNPLDVLAQQIVAMTAMDHWLVDDLYRLVRQSAPFATLNRRVFDGVLDMLSGRYPSDEFAELRPRITWDRVNGTVVARQGANVSSSPMPAPSRIAGSTACSWLMAVATPRASASSTKRWCSRRAPARPSCWAPPPGASSRSRTTACSSRRRRVSPARCPSGRAKAPGARSNWGGPSAS